MLPRLAYECAVGRGARVNMNGMIRSSIRTTCEESNYFFVLASTLAGTVSELCYKDCYGAFDVLRNIRFILALIAISMTACTSRKVDFEQVLAWLPADTESLLVANGPFWMSNF